MVIGRSFLDLLEFHRQLDEVFFRHQEALLASDVDRAVRILCVYEEALLDHMEDEESCLLPIYQQRATAVPGGPVELFLGEHRKMREFVKEFRAALAAMKTQAGRALTRAVVQLLDREFMFKHLVAHHDLREKNVLYPWLDRITTEEERPSLLKQCRGLDEASKGDQAFFTNH